MPGAIYFISYSRVDGEDFALKLGDQLTAGPPSIGVWVDRRRLQPGIDWDEQLVEALRVCEGFLYVMTEDSVSPNSGCRQEWTRALKYKKPIIPLLVHRNAELPYRLEPRQYIDFTGGFDAGLARLREHLRWRGTPEGVLHTLNERLNDARRDIARAETPERLLADRARPYRAAYAKALAVAGLALCRDAGLATAAAAAYRDARAISAAAGMLADALQDLDAIAAADSTGVLQPVRAAAAGEA